MFVFSSTFNVALFVFTVLLAVALYVLCPITIIMFQQIAVRIGTVFGDSIGKVTLTADSGRHIADDAVVLSKKQLAATDDP